jgi:hypothetical protein
MRLWQKINFWADNLPVQVIGLIFDGDGSVSARLTKVNKQ